MVTLESERAQRETCSLSSSVCVCIALLCVGFCFSADAAANVAAATSAAVVVELGKNLY